MQVAKAVHEAVEAAQSGQKRQDKLRAQVNYGFNQVSIIRLNQQDDDKRFLRMCTSVANYPDT